VRLPDRLALDRWPSAWRVAVLIDVHGCSHELAGEVIESDGAQLAGVVQMAYV